MYSLPYPNKTKKNEDSARLGTNSEHQKAKDSTLRKITAYKLFCRASLQQTPPIILCGRS
jgi:hypothetical protein